MLIDNRSKTRDIHDVVAEDRRKFLSMITARRLPWVRKAVGAIGVAASIVAVVLVAAYVRDAIDSGTAEELAKRVQDDAAFRLQPFKPKADQIEEQKQESETTEQAPVVTPDAQSIEIPNAYLANCAKCHGAGAEGKDKYPDLHHLTTREEDKLSEADLLQIINDPDSFGLSSKMPSYENKLSEEEKQEIIRWLKSL